VPAEQDAVEAAVAALAAADDKKAADPALLEVADVLGVVDLFAIVTCTSERHLKAVADEVELQLKHELDRPVLRREGTPASGWVLLDYGDVVVHVFHAEDRDVFDLERLWADVPRRDPLTGVVTDPGRLEQAERRDDLLVEG
jgi:ribosome-associated protein